MSYDEEEERADEAPPTRGSFTISLYAADGSAQHAGYDHGDPLDKPRARWKTERKDAE